MIQTPFVLLNRKPLKPTNISDDLGVQVSAIFKEKSEGWTTQVDSISEPGSYLISIEGQLQRLIAYNP